MINLLTSILMISAIGLSCPSPKNVHDEYIDVNTPRLAVYDDADYEIILSPTELTYSYDNLVEAVDSYTSNILTSAVYGVTNSDYTSFYYDEPSVHFIAEFTINGSTLIFSLESANATGNHFICTLSGVDYTPTENLTLKFTSASFDVVKAAIELDTAGDDNIDYSDLLVDILGLLTGGLTTVAGALGSGMTAYVNGLLIQNGAMSAFAATIFIFGGIALAFTLGRWIVNFISSLGNRNR